MANNGLKGLSKKRENTAERIIKALGETQGLLTMAARKAGVSYTTVKRYAAEFPSVKQAVQDAKESMLDFAEGKLYQKIKAGDNIAILFYLKTQGKSRGYIEKQEIEHSGNISNERELTDEELTSIIEGRRSGRAAQAQEGT